MERFNRRKKSQLNNSLGIKLLRFVFGFYLLVTLIVTSFQMYSEYKHTQDEVFSELVGLEVTFRDTFSAALWGFNSDIVQNTLAGLMKIKIITGVKIAFENGKIFSTIGDFINENEKVQLEEIKIEHQMPQMSMINKIESLERKFQFSWYEYSFPILIKDKIRNNEYSIIGRGSIYTNQKVFFNKVKHGFFLIIINSILKTTFLWGIFLICTKVIITNPLNRISSIMHQMDVKNPTQDTQISHLIKRKDEIGIMAQDFSRMISAISENINLINDLNMNLEKKVIIRTTQLAQKNRDMQSIFSNIKQGILSIVYDENKKSYVIDKEYSEYLEQIYQTKDVSGVKFNDFIFNNVQISSNDLQAACLTITNAFGLDEFGFLVNAHLLPKELIRNINNSKQTLEIDWGYILNQESTIYKILVVIRDVTHLKMLEEKAREQNKELAMVEQILNIGISKFKVFLSDTILIIEKCRSNYNNINEIFRLVHTLKGNARTYNLNFLVEVVHLCENLFQEIKKGEAKTDINGIKSEIDKIENAFYGYKNLYELKLMDKSNENQEIFNILDNMVNYSGDESKMLVALQSIFEIRQSGLMNSIDKIIEDEIKALEIIAINLGKEKCQVVINTNNVKISAKKYFLVKNVMTHLLRNCIDHGIELPSIRKECGKEIFGKIEITTTRVDKFIVLKIEDDGAGLNLKYLKEKGLNSKILQQNCNDEEIANLIFESGVSTAKVVSDISGRGVGMDAVREFLKQNGGDVKIVFTNEKRESGYRNFYFNLTIPI